MSRRLLFCALMAAALCQSLPGATPVGNAQQGWEKTPFERWGREEVRAVLEESPWSRVAERNSALAPMMLGAGAPKVEERLVVLLRSALPVRQALLRERQLASKYDAMSVSDRAAFDAKNSALLECPACAKHYVVSVKCPHSCYSAQYVEDYKKTFYLVNDKGGRRELAGATMLPDGAGAIFFFQRLDEKGEPLLTPASKELTFHFTVRARVNLEIVSEKFKFDVTKMVRGGEVVF